ncbi:hypothetical protein NL492_27610, partial [Klebsiella pneumoniae]|nr:hypothetical protein [Klebsiella pneumoniae]
QLGHQNVLRSQMAMVWPPDPSSAAVVHQQPATAAAAAAAAAVAHYLPAPSLPPQNAALPTAATLGGGLHTLRHHHQ